LNDSDSTHINGCVLEKEKRSAPITLAQALTLLTQSVAWFSTGIKLNERAKGKSIRFDNQTALKGFWRDLQKVYLFVLKPFD
jgi:hypothetical protein